MKEVGGKKDEEEEDDGGKVVGERRATRWIMRGDEDYEKEKVLMVCNARQNLEAS